MDIAAILLAIQAVPAAIAGLQSLISGISAAAAAIQANPPANATADQLAQLAAAKTTADMLNAQFAALLA